MSRRTWQQQQQQKTLLQSMSGNSCAASLVAQLLGLILARTTMGRAALQVEFKSFGRLA
jgi:hypothetical protein